MKMALRHLMGWNFCLLYIGWCTMMAPFRQMSERSHLLSMGGMIVRGKCSSLIISRSPGHG